MLLINMISVSRSVLRAQIKCGKCKYCTQAHRLTRLPRLSSPVSLSCSKQMSSEELEEKKKKDQAITAQVLCETKTALQIGNLFSVIPVPSKILIIIIEVLKLFK